VALIQLASAACDCPEEAARILREFEYKVERSASGSGRGGRPDEAKMWATPHQQREGTVGPCGPGVRPPRSRRTE
jgi:hypothetical protein